jgi:aminopeptidase N
MNITIPKNNKAAGMGNLIKVDTLLPDSGFVYHWQHRYPIATYLVAVAVTNYYEESHFIQLSDGDSIFHLDYIYPSYKPQADTLRWAIDGMMRGFDSLFGDYPFRKEKYGHAMFGRGGGMEHQTMSFMSRLDFDLMAHELAHQWFGNKITCGSWQDLWLNEGWATYSNAIALELIKSKKEHHDFLIKSIGRATRNNGGSVFAYDTTNVNELFNGDMRYRKGAMVLHQLRWQIGDSAFF